MESVRLVRIPGGTLQSMDELDFHLVLSQLVKPARPRPENLFTFIFCPALIMKEPPEKTFLEVCSPAVDNAEASMLITSPREPEQVPVVNDTLSDCDFIVAT